MQTTYKILIVFLFLIGFGFRTYQSADNTNAKIKATFIYNFTRYIEWPAAAQKGTFEIGVIGKTALFIELEKMSQKTTRGTQKFVVTNYTSASSLGACHMVFVSKASSGQLDAIVEKFQGKSTLVISEKEGLIEKGDINFIIVDNKQGFEINKSNIAGHGLSVASRLQAFATRVI